MPAVLLSNPGLPLAIYGNPGRRHRRRKSKARRSSKRSSLRSRIAARFPGYRVVGIRTLTSSRARRSRRRVRGGRRARRNPTGKVHRMRLKRNKRGQFMKRGSSHRTRRFHKSRARRTVGKQYRTSRGWVRVYRAHVRRHKGRKVRHPGVRWSGRRGKIGYSGIGTRRGSKGIHKVRFTNPRRRRSHRRARRNPGAVSAYIGGLTSAPSAVLGKLKGKGLVKNLAFLAGGTIATYLGSGFVMGMVAPHLATLPAVGSYFAPNADGSMSMATRLVSAAAPYTVAFAASKLLRKQLGKMSGPILLGGAVASIIELIRPGQVGAWMRQIPGLQSLAPSVAGLAGPTEALAGYVQAPSYSGVGEDALAGYVQAPSYSGVGEEQLAGYVQAPSYSGVGEVSGDLGYLNTANFLAQSYLTDQ